MTGHLIDRARNEWRVEISEKLGTFRPRHPAGPDDQPTPVKVINPPEKPVQTEEAKP